VNTRFEYLYRDGSNYKQWGGIVFRGTCDAALHNRLVAALERTEFFIAHQARLPEVFFKDGPPWADDHCWHELSEISDSTDAADDPLGRTIVEFVLEVESASLSGWIVFDPGLPREETRKTAENVGRTLQSDRS
jgi:hypothetical protein